MSTVLLPGMKLAARMTAVFTCSSLGGCLLTTSLDGLAGSGVDAGSSTARDSGTRETAADAAPDGDAGRDGNAGACVAVSSPCGGSEVCCKGVCFEALCRLCLGTGASCSQSKSPPGPDDCCSGACNAGACQ